MNWIHDYPPEYEPPDPQLDDDYEALLEIAQAEHEAAAGEPEARDD